MSGRSVTGDATARPRLLVRDGCIQVVGWLGVDTVLALREEGERVIATGSGTLEIDLSDAMGAHSAALSLLLCWSRSAAQCRRSLSFTHASEQLVALAALGGVRQALFGTGQAGDLA
ncbi:STAS domain-containing protein [Marinobacter sp. SS21]|uniref:STAS domain-containing protein n=1 Tax=Marinobacter sp. SS21 TaxID=2979460 RepID=UPI00232F7FA4|nr:STAS domain-containing protein [Marinobacter sp. SS21]MDC0661756.1 STAS domain-containing protein [Marinobacter sp. SS21]